MTDKQFDKLYKQVCMIQDCVFDLVRHVVSRDKRLDEEDKKRLDWYREWKEVTYGCEKEPE